MEEKRIVLPILESNYFLIEPDPTLFLQAIALNKE